MCTNPQHIVIRSCNAERPSRLQWLPALQTDSLYRNILPTAHKEVDVPCGKCIECLKRRQNDLAARCAREASLRGSMIFVTLTYRESMCPYAFSVVAEGNDVDTETGEIPFKMVSSAILADRDAPLLESVRASILGMPKGHISRKLYLPAPEFSAFDSGYNYYYVFTQSLRREDVRLWLKKARVRYEREHGCKLPEFSYVLVGEYGPKTCRPHYHLAFFGLNERQVSYLTAIWTEEYGEVNTKVVNAVNSDGTSGFVFAARYIGKYMTKGRFECDSVTCGYSEKPRLCASRGLGYDGTFEHQSSLSSQLLSYYRCYDLFGKYDLSTCKKSDGSYLTEPEVRTIYNEWKNRSHLTINGSVFPLPSCFIKKIWYEKDFQKSLYSSPVRQLFTSLISTNVFEDALRTHFQGRELETISTAEVREFIHCQNFRAKITDNYNFQSAKDWYKKSIY